MGNDVAQNRIVYVNGEWMADHLARVSIFDRGFLFADAIYEVTAIAQGRLIDFAGHAARLWRSLNLLNIPAFISEAELLALHREIALKNRIQEGLVYLQISRGVQDRNFLYANDLQPTIALFTQARDILQNPKWLTGISMKTMPDGRWANRHIKTVQLLYASLAKTEAVAEGFDDTLFVENGLITESCSANFHIITHDGRLVTREPSNALLHGITRASILALARQAGIRAEERAFSLDEAMQASEAFITDSIGMVVPVVSIDRQQIGSGKPGLVSAQLRELYIKDRLANGVSIST